MSTVEVRLSSSWGAWNQESQQVLLGDRLVVRAVRELPRPERVPPGNWRRMSRLARFAALALDPLIPELGDLSELPLYFGSMAGEYATGIAFLHTLFQKGPSGASPLAFQNSVHNAPAAHISMVYGMKGAVETISSGLSTPTAVLERAAVAVQVHRRPALVVCAEEYGPEVQKGLHLAELHGVFEEGACAMLLARGTGG